MTKTPLLDILIGLECSYTTLISLSNYLSLNLFQEMTALKNITKKAKVYSLLSHTEIHGGTNNIELCNNVYILFGLVKEKKKINYFLQARNPTTNPKFSLLFSLH